MSVCPFVHVFVRPSVRPSVCPFVVCLSVPLPVCGRKLIFSIKEVCQNWRCQTICGGSNIIFRTNIHWKIGLLPVSNIDPWTTHTWSLCIGLCIVLVVLSFLACSCILWLVFWQWSNLIFPFIAKRWSCNELYLFLLTIVLINNPTQNCFKKASCLLSRWKFSQDES